jgi:hypothetical protein
MQQSGPESPSGPPGPSNLYPLPSRRHCRSYCLRRNKREASSSSEILKPKLCRLRLIISQPLIHSAHCHCVSGSQAEHHTLSPVAEGPHTKHCFCSIVNARGTHFAHHRGNGTLAGVSRLYSHAKGAATVVSA